MLQRAASNAYSWWWASHIRTKQSKWLEHNLQDMEEKVNSMLRIIDDDGDSFAQRAEMYYRKRPELVGHVEESFRAYRALAERYDLLSKELQSANRTIASVFPERVQYSIEDEEEEEAEVSLSSNDSDQLYVNSSVTPKTGIPKAPKFPKKDFRSPSMFRKEPLKRTSSAKAAEKSGLSKPEALEEIDKLQKEILTLQTEKEFVKSLYERGCEKYWEIENHITDMQKRVSSLQDEFGIGTVIEDNEARTLMAATALKSCQETLVKLQEKQEGSAEEARVEFSTIQEVNKKFETLKNELFSKKREQHEVIISEEPEEVSRRTDPKISDQQLANSDNINEHIEVNSEGSLTVIRLAEKVDELVNKVVSLEIEVSSQTALVKQLKSETDVLQMHVRSLEEDKETLMESSDNLNNKFKKLEEELIRVKNLNQRVENRHNNLQSHFTEAACNLDHLSRNLKSMKLEEEVENTVFFHDVTVERESETQTDNQAPDNDSVLTNDSRMEKEGDKDDDNPTLANPLEAQEENHWNNTKPEETGKQEKNDNQEETLNSQLELEQQEWVPGGEKNKPNLRELFLKGLEEREKILLEEYTSVLHDYKDVRNKLSEVEQKNRDSVFELAMQVRELKNIISYKDEELKSLQRKVSFRQTNLDFTATNTNQEDTPENVTDAASSLYFHTPSPSLNQESIADSFGEESLSEKIEETPENLISSLKKETGKKMRLDQLMKLGSIPTIEEKLRSDIDDLLQENLEFWLRFSTSVHQMQKFQTSIHDLHEELLKLKDNNKKQPVQSDVRPIYRHLREIQTELSLWLEHSAVLQDELKSRFSSLCKIQDEISRLSSVASGVGKAELSEYTAAKFQGEVLNMKQENNKIGDELQAGLNRVRGLQAQIEKTLVKLDEELGISASKNNHSHMRNSISRARIPLRSFLFGVKLKRQKPSIFSCVNPALQKQYSDLAAGRVPPR